MLEETHIHTHKEKQTLGEQAFKSFKHEKYNKNHKTEPLPCIFVIPIDINVLKLNFCFKN